MTPARSIFARLFSPRHRPTRPHRPRRSLLPSLERLEDRTVPSTFSRADFADGYAIDSTGGGTYTQLNTTDQQIKVQSLQRGLMEFNISSIPTGATINSASLTGDVSLLQYNNIEGGVDVAFFGYKGDGVLKASDASASTNEVGSLTGAQLGTFTAPISTSFIQSLVGSSYAGFSVLLTRGEDFWMNSVRDTTFSTPPTLTIDYTATSSTNPTATDDSYSTYKNTALTVAAPGVLANDTDPAGKPLTASLVTGPSHGSLALNADGSLTYTPATGFTGTDSFTYQDSDGSLTSNVATVSIAVNDHAPVAVNHSYATDERTALTVAAPGVLAGATDADGDPLTAQLVTGPTHGTVALNANGSFTYTPYGYYYGTDSFTYRASDGTLTSNAATVNLTVRHVNQAPVAENDSYTLNENQTLTVSGQGVTSLNMTSQPGDYIGQGQTYALSPSTGSFSVSRNYDNGVSIDYQGTDSPGDFWWLDFAAPGKATLTPGDYNNATRFPFQSSTQPGLDVAGDGRGSNTLTGSFSVKQADYDPSGKVVSFDATFVQHSEGATPALTGEIKYNATPSQSGVLLNDHDPDGDPLTAQLVTGPAHGSLTLNANGSFTYTPDANFNGTDSFTYQASDGSLLSNVATVTLTVQPVNQAPSFTKGADQSVPEGSGAQTVAGWATNVSAGPANESGQALNFIVSTNNDPLFAVKPAIDPATGNLTYTPAGIVGSATVTVRLHDNGGTANGGQDTSPPQTFTITVTNVPPSVTAPNGQGAVELSPASFNLGSFTDPGPDGPWAIDVNWGDGTPHTDFSAAGIGALGKESHAYADEGNYTVNVTATDKYGASGSGTFQVNVAPAPPALTLSGPSSVDEGSTYTLGLSGTEPDSDTISGWTINWGDGAVQSVTGNPASVTHVYADGPNDYTVSATATDDDGTWGAGNTVAVHVNNVPPTAGVSGPADAVRGENRTFTLTAADVPADEAAGFTYQVNWGDGNSQTVTGLSGVTADHVFTASGNYTVSVTATDKDGGTGPAATQAVAVTAVAMQGNTLVVGGTTGDDTILIAPVDRRGTLDVTINGVDQGTFAPDSIVAYGQAGNDTIRLAEARIDHHQTTVGVPAVLLGGDGNDTLDASGSSANNILIGGSGSDTLIGGRGQDILIGGTTDFDNNSAALSAILAEWGRTDEDYATRVGHLLGTTAGGLNGPYFLTATTVHDDGAVDWMKGGKGLDWYFAATGSNGDVLKGVKKHETVTEV